MLKWEEVHAATDYETGRLTSLYADAQEHIMTLLERARNRGNDTTALESIRGQVATTLSELRDGTYQWTGQAFPRMYLMGVDSVDAHLAAPIAGSFSQIHTQAVQVLADNAYNRLDDAVNVVGRKVDDALRAIALDAITGPAFGAGTTRSAASDIFTRIVQGMDTVTAVRQDGSTYLGFQVTPGGKMWEVQNYAEMVARTTLAETMRTGSMMRMGEAGIESFQVIGGPDPCEDCQAAIDGGPYTSDDLDAMMGDSGHFTGPNCECTIVADTAALDEANASLEG